ncbi:MAG: hypothetical protein ACRBK7_01925 [Acidimicrobiales bacterium]
MPDAEVTSSSVTAAVSPIEAPDSATTGTITATTTAAAERTLDRREVVASSWSGCESKLTDGFHGDTIRIGVRSFYEDWSLGNELFTAYLEHVQTAGEVQIELVQVPMAGEIPSDIALLADFATSQVFRGVSAELPDCLPVLSSRYSQVPVNAMDLAMPALTAESEMALWAALVNRSEIDVKTVGALVLNHPAGRALLNEFERSIGSEVELITVSHETDRYEVSDEITELLAADPDVLLVMTFGEPCRQAVLAAESALQSPPAIRLIPEVCTGGETSESAWNGWLGFQRPTLDKERIEPGLRQALEDVYWSNFANESRSVLAAWWIVDAIERGAIDRRTLLDNLLTTSGGPDWLADTTKFATQGTKYPLVIEGGVLLERRDRAWTQVDFIDLDPS